MLALIGLGAGGDGEARDRADGGQGLATEAQRKDTQQVHIARIIGLQLGCGVTLYGDRQLVLGDALAIIGNQDAGQTAAVSLNLDVGRTRINGVLHQLLDGAGGTFDHFTSGDTVDGFGWEATNGHVSLKIGCPNRPRILRLKEAHISL